MKYRNTARRFQRYLINIVGCPVVEWALKPTVQRLGVSVAHRVRVLHLQVRLRSRTGRILESLVRNIGNITHAGLQQWVTHAIQL